MTFKEAVRDFYESSPIVVFLKSIGVSAILVTVLAGLNQAGHLKDHPFSLVVIVALLAPPVINLFISYLLMKGRHISNQNFDEAEIGDPETFHFEVTAASQLDIRDAAKLAKDTYPMPHDRIPEEVMLNWHEKNPEGFYVLKNSRGDFLGNLDLLALKPETFERFKHGDLFERDIQADDLFSSAEKDQMEHIHLESFVVCFPGLRPRRDDPVTALYGEAVRAFASEIPACIRKMCPAEAINRGQIKICAISANPSITKRLQQMNARNICPARHRKDGHDLFEIGFLELEKGIEELVKHRRVSFDLRGGM